MSFPDVVMLSIPLFVGLIVAEILWAKIKGKGGDYETHYTATSLLMGAGVALGFVAYGLFAFLWGFKLLDLGTSIAIILLCFVLDGLRYYWVHRFGHRVRWVWASHVNRHSSQHYNLSTALRLFYSGSALKWCWLTLCTNFGFTPRPLAKCPAGLNPL